MHIDKIEYKHKNIDLEINLNYYKLIIEHKIFTHIRMNDFWMLTLFYKMI